MWLVDPFADEEALERARALGDIAGVLQLFVGHNREAQAIASRFSAPFLKIPGRRSRTRSPSSTSTSSCGRNGRSGGRSRRGLIVAESVGAGRLYAVGPGPVGVHMVRRLLAPGELRSYRPEHLLMGHGPSIHGDEATTALNDALDRSLRDIPTLAVQAAGPHSQHATASPEIASPPMFTLDHDPIDGSHLIVAGGELDLAATSEMSAIFAMAAAGPQEAVVLDLMAVDFIDSSALGTILRAAQSLEVSGKRLHVVAPEGPVKRLLEITGTASRFSLHATRDDAFAAA